MMDINNLKLQLEQTLGSDIDQDIIFEEKKVSTISYKKIKTKEIIGNLFNIINKLAQRIEDLEKEKLNIIISPQKLVKEETLEKLWDNKEDDAWNEY